MPALFKRANGFYYAIVTDEFGRRKWISTKERTKLAALKKLPELADTKNRKLPRVRLAKFIEDFRNYAHGVYLPETLSIYDRSLKKFLLFAGDKMLVEITARHIDQFKTMRCQAAKPVTVNIELRSLKAAINTALRWKLIAENPCRGVALCPVDDVMPAYFSLQDFERLIAAINQEWFKRVVIVAVLTGMRRGEIINLKWEDVDLERRMIWIQSGKEYRTKRGKRRTIPMNPTVYRIIAEIGTVHHHDYVFTDPNGQHISDRALSVRFKRLIRDLELDERLHFNSLRHSFASWLVKEGVSIYDVQKLLGHTSIRVTEIYSHLAPEELHRSVERIPFALN